MKTRMVRKMNRNAISIVCMILFMFCMWSCKHKDEKTVTHYQYIDLPSYQLIKNDSLGNVICEKKNGVISTLYTMYRGKIYKDSFWAKKGYYVRFDSLNENGVKVYYNLISKPSEDYLIRYWLQQKEDSYELVAMDSVSKNWSFVRRFYDRDKFRFDRIEKFMSFSKSEDYNSTRWIFLFHKTDSVLNINIKMEGKSPYDSGDLAEATIKSNDETFYFALLNFELQLAHFPYLPIAVSR